MEPHEVKPYCDECTYWSRTGRGGFGYCDVVTAEDVMAAPGKAMLVAGQNGTRAMTIYRFNCPRHKPVAAVVRQAEAE